MGASHGHYHPGAYGGTCGGHEGRICRCGAVIPGGGSTEFLLEEHLDTQMDFDSLQKAGSRLGTGTMIVLDDKTCPVGMVLNLERFFSRESCGWCTPCREGLPWVAEMLKAIEKGTGAAGGYRHTCMSRPDCSHRGIRSAPMHPAPWSLCRARSTISRKTLSGISRRGVVRTNKERRRSIIDGSPYDVRADQSLLRACLSLGFDVPYFCWHPALESVGACRQCAVKLFRDEKDTKGRSSCRA